MKHELLSCLAGLGVLAVILGIAPGDLRGQAPNRQPIQSKSQPRASSASSTSGELSLNANCEKLRAAEEQIDREARTFQEKLRSEMPGLMREVKMSSPQFEKLADLSAELQKSGSEIGLRAEALASQAQETASQEQGRLLQEFERGPGFFIASSDDDSGWLGVDITEVTPDLAKSLKLAAVRGVVVKEVEPGSPAETAGLKENDVIVKYEGEPVEGVVQFRRLVRETPPGRAVTLAISRNGSPQDVRVSLGDRSAAMQKEIEGKMPYAFSAPNLDFHFGGPEVMEFRPPVLGISAEDLTGQLGAYFGAPEDSGVLVREVRPDSAAQKAGLRAGDVIIKVNGSAVRSLSDLRARLRERSDDKSVKMGILRRGSELSVTVEIEKPRPVPQSNLIHRAQL